MVDIMAEYILTTLGIVMIHFFLEQVYIMDTTGILLIMHTMVIHLIIWIITLLIIMAAITHIIMDQNIITFIIIHFTIITRNTIPT